MVGGNLCVTGCFAAKPYVAFCFVVGAASTAIVPGLISRNYISLAARTAGTLYSLTNPVHPSGQNYIVVVQPRAGSAATPHFTCTANVTSSTNFLVWCRNASDAIVGGEFDAYTIP